MIGSPSLVEDAGVAPARTEPWFAFTVGDEAFAVPRDWVQAVVDFDSVMELPNPPAMVDGIVASSGRALPLISLVARTPTGTTTSRLETRLADRALAVSVDGIELLLRCDGVLGSVDADEALAPSSVPTSPSLAEVVDGTVRIRGCPHRCLSLHRLVVAIRESTGSSGSSERAATQRREGATAFVFVERDDRWLAVCGDRLRGIHRAFDGGAEGVDLDAWLGGTTDATKPERMLDFGEGLTLHTRAAMTIVGPESATETPLPKLLEPWGERLGVRALVVRQGRFGLSLDPVAFIRNARSIAGTDAESLST